MLYSWSSKVPSDEEWKLWTISQERENSSRRVHGPPFWFIMPVASIGSVAASTFTLPITNVSCGGNPSPSPCSGGAAQLPVFNNIAGMKFFGDAGFSGSGEPGGAALHFRTSGFTGESVSGG